MGFSRAAIRVRDERGVASVELVAVVPFLILGLLIAAQLAMVGHAFWSAGLAARAGARAALVDRDAERAAIAALPGALRRGAHIDEEDGISVRVSPPRVLPLMPRLEVAATSRLEGEE